jgi:hypothetical protein
METAELRETILRALGEAAGACGALSGFTLEAANHLRAGEIREGNQKLSEILADLSDLTGLFSDVRRADVLQDNPTKERLDTLEEQSEELAELLKMALGAQERRDWVFLADILEYEFSEMLGSWNGLLGGIRPQPETGAAL